jgi:tetratricopeptide (TPR) repeat protein
MAKFFKRPESSELLRLRKHALQLIATKRYDLAEGVIRQILARNPNDADATRQLSICFFRFRRLDEAMEQARIAVSLDPNSLNLCQLAAIHMAKNQVDESIETFLQAVALKADHIPSISGLAAAHHLKGRFDEALKWADRGLAIRSEHCGMLRTQAGALAALKREPEALAAMEHFLRLEPDSAESQSSASEILKRLGKTEEASQFAHRAMQMKPADPHLHNSLAQLKLKERNYDDAQRHFESAADIYNSRQDGAKGSVGIEIQSLMGQAAVNLAKRQLQLAESQYRRVIELKPDHPLASALLAGVIGTQFRFDEALTLARQAAERNPSQVLCKVLLAGILSEMEQYGEALALTREAIELRPDYFLSHFSMASVYLDMEDYPNALEHTEKTMAIQAGPSVRRVLAKALAGMGNRERAIMEIELLLQEDSKNFYSLSAVGYAYFLLGEFQKAESHLLRATENDVSGLGCPGQLGLIYFAQGNLERALPLLEKSHNRNPYDPRVRGALRTIKGNVSPKTL